MIGFAGRRSGVLFDYSFAEQSLSRQLAGAVAQGAVGLVRYIAGHRFTDKEIDLDELDRIAVAGLGLILVWQTSGRPDVSGYDGGRQHCAEAIAQAQALGYPRGGLIFWTCDHPNVPWSNARGYARGWDSMMAESGRPYRTGVYGPRAVWHPCITERLAEVSWQPETWTPLDDQDADLIQMVNSRRTTWGGSSVDENQIRGIVPVWFPSGSPPAALVVAGTGERPGAAPPAGLRTPFFPPTGDEPMHVLQAPSETLYLVRSGRKAHLLDVLQREAHVDLSTFDEKALNDVLAALQGITGQDQPYHRVPNTPAGWQALALVPWEFDYAPQDQQVAT